MTDDATQDPDDPAHLAEIEARYAEIYEREDQRLRLRVARYAAVPMLFAVFATFPLLASLFGKAFAQAISGGWKLLVVLALDFPVLVYAGTIWWRQRFRTPNGTLYEGSKVRAAAGLVIAGSLGVLWVCVNS